MFSVFPIHYLLPFRLTPPPIQEMNSLKPNDTSLWVSNPQLTSLLPSSIAGILHHSPPPAPLLHKLTLQYTYLVQSFHIYFSATSAMLRVYTTSLLLPLLSLVPTLPRKLNPQAVMRQYSPAYHSSTSWDCCSWRYSGGQQIHSAA